MVPSLSQVVRCDETVVAAVQSNGWHYLSVHPRQRRIGDGPYPDFGVNIVDGIVWFWLLGKWQDLPNELWAWKRVTVWMVGHYYHGRRLWVPSLLLFDFWQYDRSSYAPVSPSAIDRQPVPPAKVIIVSWLPRILHNSGDPELRRTCRIVCRDWEKALPFGEPGRDYLQFEDGAVWYWIEQEWRHLPHKYWAWTLCDTELRTGPPQDRWHPKLIQPVDDSIRRGPKYLFTPSSPLSPSSALGNPGFSRAAALPPELFKYICNQADSYSWSFRLVSRYWSRQCHAQIFKETSAGSPERIQLLWTHRMDPLMQQLELIRDVPRYDSASQPPRHNTASRFPYYINGSQFPDPRYNSASQFPWLHRLTQLCDSTSSAWMDQLERRGHITINGPIAKKYGRIRSVHFALPRSLPRSLSRGIKTLDLDYVKFRRFEDLTHLVCELPDLEELECVCHNLDPPPTELPRRPRTNRNKLSKVRVCDRWATSLEVESVPVTSTLMMFLSVYAVPSFFSEGELAVLLALLQLLRHWQNPAVRYEDDPDYHSRGIVYSYNDGLETVLSLHIIQDPTRTHTALYIIADCANKTVDKDLAHWIRLDTEFSKIADLMHRVECVFGFEDHETMVHFAMNVLAKMPSISRLALVRFSLHDSGWPRKWYRASLDSEELTGIGERDLAKVYS